MRPVMQQARSWLVSSPAADIRRWSLALAVTASTLVMFDTIQLLVQVRSGLVVAVPYFGGGGTDWWVVVAIGAWLVGTIGLLFRRTRAGLGWLAPVGLFVAGLGDRQAFTDVIVLVTVGLGMHWWSALLERRPQTAHLHGVPLRVLQVMISIVLGWATYAKLNPRFMSGAVLSVSFHGPIPPLDVMLDRTSLVAMALLTVVVEGFLAAGLWIDTLRRPALVIAALFHLFIVAYFGPAVPLAAFALAMGSGYLLFAGEPWKRGTPVGAESTAYELGPKNPHGANSAPTS